MTQQAGPRAHGALLNVAREDLKRWAAVYTERNARVIRASRSGLATAEIARITGLAKTTVLRILRGA